MTRINVIPVEELHSKHLIAELHELPRLYKLARNTKPNEQPMQYTLGKGHVLFFYDKLRFINNRHKLLISEMHHRGFKTSFTADNIENNNITLWNDYEPTPEAMEINRARIKERLEKMKLRNH